MKEILSRIEEKMKERNYLLYATSNDKTILHYGTPPEERPNIACEIYLYKNDIVSFKFRYITKKLIILTTEELGSFFNDEQFNKFETDFWNLACTLYNAEN